jgi:hypothetical protein
MSILNMKNVLVGVLATITMDVLTIAAIKTRPTAPCFVHVNLATHRSRLRAARTR